MLNGKRINTFPLRLGKRQRYQHSSLLQYCIVIQLGKKRNTIYKNREEKQNYLLISFIENSKESTKNK
jgi:hypothetical protein